jgi:hypothetical protein
VKSKRLEIKSDKESCGWNSFLVEKLTITVIPKLKNLVDAALSFQDF